MIGRSFELFLQKAIKLARAPCVDDKVELLRHQGKELLAVDTTSHGTGRLWR